MRVLFEGIKGFFVLISVFLMAVLPIVIAVTGYLSLFHELNWLYPVVIIGVWFLSQFVSMYGAKEGTGVDVMKEGVGGGMGFVWMLSLPASIWFLVSAVFMDGSWTKFIYSFVLGAFAKGYVKQSNQSPNE